MEWFSSLMSLRIQSTDGISQQEHLQLSDSLREYHQQTWMNSPAILTMLSIMMDGKISLFTGCSRLAGAGMTWKASAGLLRQSIRPVRRSGLPYHSVASRVLRQLRMMFK